MREGELLRYAKSSRKVVKGGRERGGEEWRNGGKSMARRVSYEKITLRGYRRAIVCGRG